jgi:hypothetical protein
MYCHLHTFILHCVYLQSREESLRAEEANAFSEEDLECAIRVVETLARRSSLGDPVC